MLFFSTLVGTKVINTATNTEVGSLADLVVHTAITPPEQLAPVVGIMVKAGWNLHRYIAVENIIEWGGVITVQVEEMTAEKTFVPGPGLALVGEGIVDKQIVDLSGVRVVRVNDLQLSLVQGKMYLVSIDISNQALWRRLGAPAWFWSRLKPQFLSWKDVQVIGNKLQLSTEVEKLNKLHPADIANVIEQLNLPRGSALLQSLDKDIAARVLEEIRPDVKKVLVKSLGPERAALLMAKMSVDELVDLIQLLPTHDAREIIARLPSTAKMQKIKKILEYDEDKAGGLMTTEYVAISPEATVAEAVEKIKEVSTRYRAIHYVYVVDKAGKFLGLASLRNLITTPMEEKVSHIMRHAPTVPTVSVTASLTTVALIMTKYNLYSLTVLGVDQRIVGIITVDDIMRRFLPHA